MIGRDPLPPRQTQPVPIVDKPPPPTRSPTQQPPPPQVNNVIPITTSPTGNSDVTHKRVSYLILGNFIKVAFNVFCCIAL